MKRHGSGIRGRILLPIVFLTVAVWFSVAHDGDLPGGDNVTLLDSSQKNSQPLDPVLKTELCAVYDTYRQALLDDNPDAFLATVCTSPADENQLADDHRKLFPEILTFCPSLNETIFVTVRSYNTGLAGYYHIVPHPAASEFENVVLIPFVRHEGQWKVLFSTETNTYMSLLHAKSGGDKISRAFELIDMPGTLLALENLQYIFDESLVSGNQRDFEIDMITYHFEDASVPPEYHRSYTITVTPDKINIVVDSYGEIISTKHYQNTAGKFNIIQNSIKAHNIGNGVLGESDGCTGGTAESVSLSYGGKEQFSGTVYHCGGEDTGNLCGDMTHFLDDLKRLIPDFDELISAQTHDNDVEKEAVEDGGDVKEIKRDEHFVAYANGVVHDTRTGLEWLAGPNKDTNWKKAKAWVEDLDAAGGGWRMPTCGELSTLYKKDAGPRNMSPLFKGKGMYAWSGEIGEIKGSLWSRWEAAYFNFNLNGFNDSDFFWFSSDFRVLAVRMGRPRNLMSAAYQLRLPLVKEFIDAGANVNAKDEAGRTVLMMTLKNDTHAIDKLIDQNKIVQLLVEKGADVNARSENGDSALTFARKKGLTQSIEIIEKQGAGRE